MNADTQQWLLCNTSPDVLSMMPPTIMATVNFRLVFSGFLAQSLHGTVVVAGNILLDLVKQIFSCFGAPPFQLHSYPLLSPLVHNRFSCKHSICSFHHIVGSPLSGCSIEEDQTGMKGLHCSFTAKLKETFSLFLLYWFTINFSMFTKQKIISFKSQSQVKVLRWFNPAFGFSEVQGLREDNFYISKFFLIFRSVPQTGTILPQKPT